jgi:hypothetical protein
MPTLPSLSHGGIDDDHAVANAGLALVGLDSEKLNPDELCEETISIALFRGRRAVTLVHAMVAGGSCMPTCYATRDLAGPYRSVFNKAVPRQPKWPTTFTWWSSPT